MARFKKLFDAFNRTGDFFQRLQSNLWALGLLVAALVAVVAASRWFFDRYVVRLPLDDRAKLFFTATLVLSVVCLLLLLLLFGLYRYWTGKVSALESRLNEEILKNRPHIRAVSVRQYVKELASQG